MARDNMTKQDRADEIAQLQAQLDANGFVREGRVRDASSDDPDRPVARLFDGREHVEPGSNPDYFSMQDLSVGYNGRAIIHDINIDIAQGDIVALIGPNGAGKSTILKSITRQLAMIGGKVMFDNSDITSMTFRDLSSRLAVVLTDRLHPELMTCHDIVATGRYPYTGRLGVLTRADEDKVDEAMRAVHANELGGRDFNSISDGQKQRVLLARAICQEPDVLLLDEPTSFLDIRYKLDLLSILRSMAKDNGITVITSLHEIDLAMKIADKIVCVKGDTIFRAGPPEEIFEEQMIRDMYDIQNGYFDPLFGSIELPCPEGQPQAFVMSSSGNGVRAYRRLQKLDTPFVAGILYTNDIDYQLARLLAQDVVTEKPFCDIAPETLQKAREWIDAVPRVIDAGVEIGQSNQAMRELLAQAERDGKLERM